MRQPTTDAVPGKAGLYLNPDGYEAAMRHPSEAKFARQRRAQKYGHGAQQHPDIDWRWPPPRLAKPWTVYGPDGEPAVSFRTRRAADAAVAMLEDFADHYTVAFTLDPDQRKRVDGWHDMLVRWADSHRRWEDTYQPCVDRWHCRQAALVLELYGEGGIEAVIEWDQPNYDRAVAGGDA